MVEDYPLTLNLNFIYPSPFTHHQLLKHYNKTVLNTHLNNVRNSGSDRR